MRHEWDKVRQSLRDTDENIRKLTGRETLENRFRPRDNFGVPPIKRQNIGGPVNWVPGRPAGNRFHGGIHPAADSGDEDELTHKPVIQSSVVATQKDSKSRQDIIQQQNSDEKGKARNRRMFGLLMGTLQQFRAEEKQKESQEMKRKAVEQKLEEKQKEEKEKLKTEKQQLFIDRKEKLMQMKQLENKIELVKLHEEWEEQTRTLMNFIRCNSKPHIFYLPKSHNEASQKKHQQTKAALEAIIDERKKQLHEEIDENARIGGQVEEKKQKRGHNLDRASRRHGNDEEAEKMDVSDLEEEDTGVNVDYGVSGDEEENPAAATADVKVLRQKKKENPSPDKRHKSSRHSRDTGHHRSRDDAKLKHQAHRRSSKWTERKSEACLGMSEEVPCVAQVEKEDEADKMEVDKEETKLHDESIEEDDASTDKQNNGFDLNDIPCPTTATELEKSPSTGDDIVIVDSNLDAQ